ncbi:MAG: iron-containing alcohol dehydrogenase [Bacteroidales bacterium]|nr:iron-containing alcohol dehydrogenase [Bacteroidales bacterium]
MKDFKYYAPTEVAFGRDSEERIGELALKYGAHKVLVHYGGSSAVRSGLLDKVYGQLQKAGLAYVSLGGVVPNPRVSKVREGIELCRREGVDFILAVGGGSVIDSAKAISVGVSYDGDVWDFYTRKAYASVCLPLATVLTIPAAGSEMSDGSVITNEDGNLKKDYCTDIFRCKFAVMNPERTFTLPPFQTACGVVDMMMHTMERYFSHDDDMVLTDAVAESILRTVMDCAFKVLRDPQDYVARAQLMWAGSIAHNDLTGCGTTGDWGTHMIEHELSGMFDVAHGAGLAAVWGSWARNVYMLLPSRFARFAVNVMGVTNDFTSVEKTALAGIEAAERFFHAIGMPVSIPELIGRPATEEEILKMADTCTGGDSHSVGVFKPLWSADIAAIYRAANG